MSPATATGARTAPTLGESAPIRRFGPITRTHIVRYAGASGDFNPIHHDEVFATGAGYRSVLAHGMLTAGILSTFVTGWLGREHLRGYSVRYVDQVWPRDELVVTGSVTARDDTGTETRVGCTFEVVAQDADGISRTVLQGTADAIYPHSRGSNK